VQVLLNEDGDDTSAGAALTVENKMQLRGHGTSTRNPRDGLEPRIGDELPAARALFDLAHQLLSVAASDVESKTHVPARSLGLRTAFPQCPRATTTRRDFCGMTCTSPRPREKCSCPAGSRASRRVAS
jgi:hypothetical protein